MPPRCHTRNDDLWRTRRLLCSMLNKQYIMLQVCYKILPGLPCWSTLLAIKWCLQVESCSNNNPQAILSRGQHSSSALVKQMKDVFYGFIINHIKLTKSGWVHQNISPYYKHYFHGNCYFKPNDPYYYHYQSQ